MQHCLRRSVPHLHGNEWLLSQCHGSYEPKPQKGLFPMVSTASLDTPTDLKSNSARSVARALNGILADSFALYLKTKSFHWHVSGPHFRDYHLLFDEQAAQIFAATDYIAERVRKTGNMTLRSIGDIARHQSVADNNLDFVAPGEMLQELREDNLRLIEALRETKGLTAGAGDDATAAMIDGWIDQAEGRVWFLFEASRTD
jgi:starvation-inducible DNA-binding protein